MASHPPFHSRPLDEHGTIAAVELAAAAGAPGIYLCNALRARDGEAVGLFGDDALLGCLWFGPRGNLVVLQRVALDPERLADAVVASRWPWRIALGPPAPIDALVGRLTGAPLVHREQVYYGCRPAEAVVGAAAAAARAALRADRDRLIAATLELNRSDLNVDPRRVDRRWLRSMVDARIADGSSLVIGAPGAFDCKLDLGSRGAAGLVLEGVYTFPPMRGRGLASALVGAAAARATEPFVCLHVAAANAPARRAYEHAGLRELARCRLLLSG